MNIAAHNYRTASFNFRREPGSEMETAKTYQYESSTAVYELLVIGKAEYVRVNFGPWCNRIDGWHPIHYAVRDYAAANGAFS